MSAQHPPTASITVNGPMTNGANLTVSYPIGFTGTFTVAITDISTAISFGVAAAIPTQTAPSPAAPSDVEPAQPNPVASPEQVVAGQDVNNLQPSAVAEEPSRQEQVVAREHVNDLQPSAVAEEPACPEPDFDLAAAIRHLDRLEFAQAIADKAPHVSIASVAEELYDGRVQESLDMINQLSEIYPMRDIPYFNSTRHRRSESRDALVEKLADLEAYVSRTPPCEYNVKCWFLLAILDIGNRLREWIKQNGMAEPVQKSSLEVALRILDRGDWDRLRQNEMYFQMRSFYETVSDQFDEFEQLYWWGLQINVICGCMRTRNAVEAADNRSE